jgi:elongation factor G
MATEFVAPEACVGDVMGLVQSRRGRVLALESQGAQRVVRAEVPMASLFGQVTALRSRTQGRASMSARFSHYAPARSA